MRIIYVIGVRKIDHNATPVAFGVRNRNLNLQPGTPYPGIPASRQQYIGTPVGLQGGFFHLALAVPTYAGYQEPIPTSHPPENLKSAVPRLKNDYTNSYLVLAQKFCINLIFHNLRHVTDEGYMKSMLPTSWDQVFGEVGGHPWALAVRNNERVMVLCNDSIQDNATSMSTGS